MKFDYIIVGAGSAGCVLSNRLSENSNNKIAVLHCVSSYPCPLEYVNLNKISEISKTFKVISGLSDHTIEVETPSLAVVGGLE